MKQPALRFKRSNDGEFPDWECKKIKDIASKMKAGGTPKANVRSYYDGDIPFLGISDISKSGKYVSDTMKCISPEGLQSSSAWIVPAGTLILSMYASYGKPCISKVDLATSQALIAIELKGDYSVEFIYQVFSKFLNSGFWNKYVKTGAQPNLSKSVIESTDIYSPCLEEQQKIASFFSTLDQKIELNERKLEALEKLKKGLLQKIFKQELKFNHSNQSWANVCLIDIADVRDGTHDSPSYVPSGFPLVTSKNLLKNGEIDIESTNKISVSDYDNINKRSKVDVGDILFGMIGTIGRPVLVKESGFAIKNVALIKPKSDAVNNVFLYYLFRSDIIFKQLCENKTGGNQKFVSLKIIRNLLIPLPDKDEQNHIADFLSKFDKKLAIEKQRQKLLLDLKKGLMQQMFV